MAQNERAALLTVFPSDAAPQSGSIEISADAASPALNASSGKAARRDVWKALAVGVLIFFGVAAVALLPALIETRDPEAAVERTVASIAAAVAPSSAPPARQIKPRSHSEAEALLFDAVNALHEGSLNRAEQKVNTLLARYPNYQLGHLIRADILRARAGKLTQVADGAPKSKELAGLLTELEARVGKYSEPAIDGKRPEPFVQLAPQVRYAIAVDASRSRLYVLENAPMGPRRVLDMYATIGASGSGKAKEGDKRTPVGVYNILNAIERDKLTDFYGDGAFPLDYPNVLDKRAGKSGSGIWIHGVPKETFARAPRSSEGCIVVSNEDLKTLTPYIQPGHTQIAIADAINWIPAAQVSKDEHALRKAIESWRTDWESRDMNRYIDHYATQFFSDKVSSREEWRVVRKSVTEDKASIRVDLNNLTIAHLPAPQDTMLVMFDQNYKSDTAQTTLRKRQYWQREGSRWKIIYEGNA
jgi:murein L,D-transpeptidase YafK